MIQIISLIWGILSVAGMILGFLPCFGSLNWINIPFALLGLLIAIVAYARINPDAPRGKKSAVTGIVLCAIAAVFGAFRLFLGGGIF